MPDNCNNYCADPLDEQDQIDCQAYLPGGISAALLLECDTQLVDPSNATQVQAEIDAGRAHLLLNIKMGLPAASPVTVDSPVAGGTPVLSTYDRTATLVDANITPNNVALYDKLLVSYKLGGILLYENGSEERDAAQVTWIDRTIQATGSRIIPDNPGELQNFTATFTWRGLLNGNIYDAPVGIFTS